MLEFPHLRNGDNHKFLREELQLLYRLGNREREVSGPRSFK